MFEIYSKPQCPNCDKAKSYLNNKGLPFKEYKLDVGQVKEEGGLYFTVDQLQKLVPGARTVPQIFNDGKHVGGFEALVQYLA